MSLRFLPRFAFLLVFIAGWMISCVAPPSPPSTESAVVPPAQDTVLVSSLDEAQQRVDFPVQTPSWLPPGYRLVNIWVTTTPRQMVQLQYRKSRWFLTLDLSVVEVWFPQDEVDLSIPATGEKVGEKVEVRGQPGLLRVESLGYRTLQWREGRTIFFVSGFEPTETLVRIAESLSQQP